MAVAVFQSERLGDSIMALPAVHAFVRAHDEEPCYLITDNATKSLYEHDPHYTEVISFSYRSGIGAYVRVARILRALDIHTILIIPGGFFAALISFLARIPTRIGHTTDMRGILLTHKVKHAGGLRHQTETSGDLLTPLGISVTSFKPRLTIKLDTTLHLPQAYQTTIALAPFTRDEVRKMYPLDKWRSLITSLTEKGHACAVFGSPAEAKRYRAFLDEVSANERVNDCVGKYSLHQTASLIAQCDVAITNDSGLMHLSYALGVPTVALFGSTVKERTAPRSNHAVMVESRYTAKARTKEEDMRLMREIAEEDILTAIESILTHS